MKHQHQFDQNGDLRDIFAALAMQSLIKEAYGSGVTTKWVAHQAYKYADAMLDVRDEVSDTKENQK
jgi:hypothetical protein